MSIGDRIKQVRGTLTRDEFALKLSIDKSTAQRYENDNNIPKGDVLQRIHEQFNININWLLTGEGDQYINKDRGTETLQTADSSGLWGDTRRINVGDKQFDVTLFNTKRPGSKDQVPNISISDALTMTARILESNTSYATALYLNIQHFDRAIRAEQRIDHLENECNDLKERLTIFEKQLTNLSLQNNTKNDNNLHKSINKKS